jgi:hypothetical protein
MHNPYAVLGIEEHADQQQIRARYLELVRESPPDRDPERFALIRSAYDELRQPEARVERAVRQVKSLDSLDALADDVHRRLAAHRWTAESLLRLGGDGA